MKHLLYSLLLFCILLLPATAQTSSFTYDGSNRTYIVHVPANYTGANPVPLVFNLHGLGSNGGEQQAYTLFDQVADTAGFIVVYPNGLSSTWNVGWVGSYNSGTDDVGFLSALIDTMAAHYNIDLSRVYSTGMSNGGFMSYRLACDLSGRIAAIASVTGTMTDSMAYYCDTEVKIPVMHIHGTADGVVPYNGINSPPLVFYAADSSVKFWVEHNQCISTPVVTNIPDINTADSTTVVRFDYNNCGEQSKVSFLKVIDGGHTWPGAAININNGFTNRDISASSEIWNFFKQFSNKSVGIEKVTTHKEDKPIKAYPVPFHDKLYVEVLSKEVKSVQLHNLLGAVVLTEDHLPNQDRLTLDTSSLPEGIYFLQAETTKGIVTYKLIKR